MLCGVSVDFALSLRLGGAGRRQPFGIEPAVGRAIVRQARHVPVANVFGVDVPHGRAAADINNATGKLLQRFFGIHIGSQDEEGSVAAREFGHGADGLGTGDQHMTTCDIEETCDVGDVFGVAVAFPGQLAVKAELA